MIINKLTLEEIHAKIKKNKKYRALMESFQDSELYRIPLEKYKSEILTLHQAREVRTLYKFCQDESLSMIDGIIRCNLQDQSYRSRMAEIHIQCVRARSALSDSVKLFKDYAIIRYDSYLSKIRTKGERSTFIDVILQDMQQYIDDCDMVIELAAIAIKDIDNAGWALSRTVDALKLTQSPERKI